MNINPRQMDLFEWADSMVLELSRHGIMGHLDDATNWRDFAVRACELPAIATQNPPDPNSFSDWREWAERFQAIEV